MSSTVLAALQEAPKVTVGDKAVDGARLQPYVNQWGMHVTKPDGTDIPDAGLWKDQLEAVEFAGHQGWKRTQDATFKKQDGSIAGHNITINIFDRSTMAPLYREFRSMRPGQPDKDVRITFSSVGLHIESTEAGKTASSDVKAGPAFDFDGGLYAVLWSAFPLKVGYTASFPSYSEGDNPGTVNWHGFKVLGTEDIQEKGMGTVKALVVEGDTESGPLKYWLITKPPFVLRMDYHPSNGTHWQLDRV